MSASVGSCVVESGKLKPELVPVFRSPRRLIELLADKGMSAMSATNHVPPAGLVVLVKGRTLHSIPVAESLPLEVFCLVVAQYMADLKPHTIGFATVAAGKGDKIIVAYWAANRRGAVAMKTIAPVLDGQKKIVRFVVEKWDRARALAAWPPMFAGARGGGKERRGQIDAC